MQIALIKKIYIQYYLFNTAVEIGNSGTRVRARPHDRMSPLRLLTLFFFFFFFFYFNFTSQTKMSVFNFDKKNLIVLQNKRGLKVVAGNANEFFQNFNMTFRIRAFNTLVTKFCLVIFFAQSKWKNTFFQHPNSSKSFRKNTLLKYFIFSMCDVFDLVDRYKRLNVFLYRKI